MSPRILAAVAALAVALTGCAVSEATDDPAAASAPVGSVDEQAEGRTWIDVRTPGEYAAGHLDGAMNVDLNSGAFAEQIAELPRDGSYFVYCKSGNRSAQAAAIMADLGFTDVVDGGGFADLARAGLPVAN